MDLPLLLAGPIVRRVDSSGATFWLAFSESGHRDGDGVAGRPGQHRRRSGAVRRLRPSRRARRRPTARFGEKLHVVTVTATPRAGFAPRAGRRSTPTTSTCRAPVGSRPSACSQDSSAPGRDRRRPRPARLALGYLTDRLPTFVTAAGRLDDLRFAHTSCRKPHGSGPDALAWLDDVIDDERLDPCTGPSTCSSPATRSTPTTWPPACCRCSPAWPATSSASTRPCRLRPPAGPLRRRAAQRRQSTNGRR